MEGAGDETMSMDCGGDETSPDATVITSNLVESSVFILLQPHDELDADKIDAPTDPCSHCASHSENHRTPGLSASVSGEAQKVRGIGPLAIVRFASRAELTVAQIGLPREHAPPVKSIPLNILLNVFLI